MNIRYISQLMIIPFLLLTIQVNAQLTYTGGDGGGSTSKPLSGALEDIAVAGIYSGGNGNGNYMLRFLNIFENPQTKGIYSGGIGKGDIVYNSFLELGNDKTAVLYRGGKGRGDRSSVYISYLVTIGSELYRGGAGRGDTLNSLLGYLRDEGSSMLYSGGRGRGDVTISSYAPLQSINAPVYAGGPGRGDYVESFKGELIDISNTRQMIVQTTLGAALFSVKALPNPSSNYFTLNISGRNNDAIRLRITDVSGKLMQDKIIEGGTQQVQLGDNWQNGTYFLEVSQGTDRKVVKLVKMK